MVQSRGFGVFKILPNIRKICRLPLASFCAKKRKDKQTNPGKREKINVSSEIYDRILLSTAVHAPADYQIKYIDLK